MKPDTKAIRAALENNSRLKQAVIDWMDQQTKECRLARNGDAPMWHQYEASLAALPKDAELLALVKRVEALETTLAAVAVAIDATHPDTADAIRKTLEGE